MSRTWKAAQGAVAAAVWCLAVAACGGASSGSGPDGPEGTDHAADAAPTAVVAAHATAPASSPDASASAPSWTRIAVEGTTATVGPGQTVRYGFGDQWVSRQASGTVACTTASFGRDPVPGIVKQCDLLEATGADAGDWQRFAWEYQVIHVSAPAVLRYGTGTRWIEKQLPAGEASCTSDVFGADPAPGLAKQCQVRQVAVAAAAH